MTVQSVTVPTQPATARCPYYALDATGSDIHGEGRALRALGAATRVLLPGDIPAWSVTDRGLIRRLLTHPHISKDAHRHWTAYMAGEIPADWPLGVWVNVRNALTAYGIEHQRLRRPLAAAFSVRRVRAMVPQIEAIIRTLLDDLQTAGPREVVDLRARFAWRLPLLAVNAALGVPEALHDSFHGAIGDLFATDLTPEQAIAAQDRIYDLIGQLIARKKLGDDVSSDLIAARTDGRLSDQELAESGHLLLIGAGHETTANLLDHAVVDLLTHPDQLAIATTGQVAWEQVVDEVLRHQAPVASIIPRFAVHDVHDEATGVTFRQGDLIVINFAGANRDPLVHGQDAHKFNLRRATSRDHLSFGHGPHLCPGAELARTEARLALAALFTRFPQMRLAIEPGQLTPLPSFISNGHQRVPVILGPASS